MLAMLVCVFSDLQLSNKASRQESHQSDPDFGAPPLKSTGDYLSSRAKSHPQRMPSELSVPIVSQKHISESQSTTSSTGPPLSDLSTSQTPPSDDRTLHPSSGPQNSQALSLSSSPEHYRHTHRSNSNLSALAASFSRSFSFRTSAASSPPNTTYLKKRSSPVGSYLGNPSSAITWSSSIFSKSSTITEGPRSTFSLSVSDTEEDTAPVLKWPGFRTTLKHRDHFHHDGHSNIISLDPTKRWRYRAYQEAYAHLLYIWNMPTARAEMLKYNHYSEPPESSSPFNFAPKPAAPTIATASAHTLDADHSPRPVFRDHCPSCFNLLPLQSPSRRCQSCSRPRTPLFCILCTTIIRGLSSPCSNCGHVLHASCRQLLFSESDAPITECPSGCGCVCANHSTMQLPAPIAESNSGGLGKDVSPAVTVIGDEGVNDQEELGWKENGEDVAYESLARNLMPRRKVRAKGSRIWRGRKGSR